ncbi:MAG TPA: hypothetical protein DCF62_03370 [Porticoccaceae bacterium]|nr:hypothetical protein [Porticoccaceae bacterium]
MASLEIFILIIVSSRTCLVAGESLANDSITFVGWGGMPLFGIWGLQLVDSDTLGLKPRYGRSVFAKMSSPAPRLDSCSVSAKIKGNTCADTAVSRDAK